MSFFLVCARLEMVRALVLKIWQRSPMSLNLTTLLCVWCRSSDVLLIDRVNSITLLSLVERPEATTI